MLLNIILFNNIKNLNINDKKLKTLFKNYPPIIFFIKLCYFAFIKYFFPTLFQKIFNLFNSFLFRKSFFKNQFISILTIKFPVTYKTFNLRILNIFLKNCQDIILSPDAFKKVPSGYIKIKVSKLSKQLLLLVSRNK